MEMPTATCAGEGEGRARVARAINRSNPASLDTRIMEKSPCTSSDRRLRIFITSVSSKLGAS
jgi:hypothetical protein